MRTGVDLPAAVTRPLPLPGVERDGGRDRMRRGADAERRLTLALLDERDGVLPRELHPL